MSTLRIAAFAISIGSVLSQLGYRNEFGESSVTRQRGRRSNERLRRRVVPIFKAHTPIKGQGRSRLRQATIRRWRTSSRQWRVPRARLALRPGSGHGRPFRAMRSWCPSSRPRKLSPSLSPTPPGVRTPLRFRRYRFTLSEDRVDNLFSCRTLYDEPTLRFFNEPLSHSSTSVLMAGGGGTSVALLKSVDRSLVVNWRSDTVALTLFVLGSGYRVDNLWYRYAPFTSERPAER